MFLDGSGREAQELRGVGQVHHHLVLPGAAVAQFLQEVRRPGAASGRVDDKLGGKGRLLVDNAVHDPYPGDTVTSRRRGQSDHIMAVEEGHVRYRPHPAPNIAFQ